MILNAEPGPGHKEYLELQARNVPILVYLNGQKQRGVIAVDSEEGWLLRYRADEYGRLTNEREERTGRVEIEIDGVKV